MIPDNAPPVALDMTDCNFHDIWNVLSSKTHFCFYAYSSDSDEEEQLHVHLVSSSKGKVVMWVKVPFILHHIVLLLDHVN